MYLSLGFVICQMGLKQTPSGPVMSPRGKNIKQKPNSWRRGGCSSCRPLWFRGNPSCGFSTTALWDHGGLPATVLVDSCLPLESFYQRGPPEQQEPWRRTRHPGGHTHPLPTPWSALQHLHCFGTPQEESSCSVTGQDASWLGEDHEAPAESWQVWAPEPWCRQSL